MLYLIGRTPLGTQPQVPHIYPAQAEPWQQMPSLAIRKNSGYMEWVGGIHRFWNHSVAGTVWWPITLTTWMLRIEIYETSGSTSSFDKQIGFRWSPIQISRFHRDQRYQILPAYTQKDVLLSRVFQGSADASMFEDFIEQLHHGNRWPEPRSVIITDNVSFHRTEGVEQMRLNPGVTVFQNTAVITYALFLFHWPPGVKQRTDRTKYLLSKSVR